ncbi:olfactory receptor 10A3-like [Xenopus laevis]|nr:olfactory receptor 10A3-like [Xenopus laevis]
MITEFFLFGFGNLQSYKNLFFAMCLLVYIMVLTGNVLVIILVADNQSLHLPMYFFLSQLSLTEIIFTTNIVPNMLRLILGGGGTMSVIGCITQFYLLCVPSINECLLLAAMSYDRHVAICNPLRYTSIMTLNVQLLIVFLCWFSGFMMSLLIFVFVYKLEFCSSNIINHFYCDIAPLLELSCSDTFSVELVTSVASMLVVLSPFLFIIIAYISVFLTILKIPSSCGRQKAFSTCSSHLAVVCMYYGTLITIYIYPPANHSLNANKALSLLYTLVTPFFNPIIYSLRNQDIRRALYKSFQKLSQRLVFK